MSDIAGTRSIRAHLSKASPTLVIVAIVLFGLTYYGVMLNLASAPHLNALDRTTFLQSEQIARLTADLSDLKRQNDEMRETIAASHERVTERSGEQEIGRPAGVMRAAKPAGRARVHASRKDHHWGKRKLARDR